MKKTFIAVAVVLMMLFSATTAFSAENENNKRFEACRVKLLKAQKLGVLYAIDWKPHKEPYVVAGQTFFNMAIDAKEGFAETVNCFLTAGDKSHVINFNILDWRTGKKVGRFSYGKLHME